MRLSDLKETEAWRWLKYVFIIPLLLGIRYISRGGYKLGPIKCLLFGVAILGIFSYLLIAFVLKVRRNRKNTKAHSR